MEVLESPYQKFSMRIANNKNLVIFTLIGYLKYG